MDWKVLLVVFFYNQIKAFAQRMLGSLAIPVDYILLAIGWWKKETWWGQGLLYGAVASIGSTMGSAIVSGLPLAGAGAGSQTQVIAGQNVIF
jgi:hypothetical protein